MELMVAMGLSMLILGVATALFKNSTDTSSRGLSQIEMQQNLRGSLNLVARDVSVAGVGGFPRVGVTLPTASPISPVKYACDAVTAPTKPPTCPPFADTAKGTYANGTLYPINVFSGAGPTAFSQATDVIVTVAVDSTFCSATPVTVDVKTAPTHPTATLPAVKPASCTSGTLTASPGDVFMFTGASGSVVAELTAVNTAKTVLTFGDSDALNMNQSAATANTINALLPGGGLGLTMSRLNVVTYYVSFTAPTLMRQVNAQSPAPAAENIENLQFTYDLFGINSFGNPVTTLGVSTLDRAADPPQDSTQIRKVNISVTGRSRFPDSRGEFRRAALVTFVSPRSLSFFDRYAN